MICRHISAVLFAALLYLCLLLLPAAAAAESSRFKVGFILSLSGAWAEFGIAQRNAAELARHERPDLFERFDFVYEDCEQNGAKAIGAFNKLKAQDGVDLIFVFGSEAANAVAPLAEAQRIPTIVAAQVPEPTRGRHFVIRSMNDASQYSIKLLRYLRTKGVKKFYVMLAQVSIFEAIVRGMRENLEPSEQLEVVDSFVPAMTDFRMVIAKLKHRNLSYLGVFLTPPQIVAFFKEVKNQHLGLFPFGPPALQSSSLNELTGGALEGAVYVHTMASEDFRRRYLAAFGNDHQLPWAANAYDTVFLIADLFQPAQKHTPESIMQRLAEFPAREGAGGRFAPKGSPETGKYFDYPVAIFEIKGGEHQRVY